MREPTDDMIYSPSEAVQTRISVEKNALRFKTVPSYHWPVIFMMQVLHV